MPVEMRHSPEIGIAADFNGDQLPDLVTLDPSEALAIALNRGNGTFDSAVRLAVPAAPRQMTAADLDTTAISTWG